MKLLRPAALAVAGATLVVGSATGATAATAPAVSQPAASVGAQSEGISLGAGSLQVASQIYDLVVQQIESGANREGLVKSLREAAWYAHDESKNVLVIKADHNYTADLQGVTLDAVYRLDRNPSFRVVVFDSGTVTNNGDGGYINWAFQGWFDRTDATVTFH